MGYPYCMITSLRQALMCDQQHAGQTFQSLFQHPNLFRVISNWLHDRTFFSRVMYTLLGTTGVSQNLKIWLKSSVTEFTIKNMMAPGRVRFVLYKMSIKHEDQRSTAASVSSGNFVPCGSRATGPLARSEMWARDLPRSAPTGAITVGSAAYEWMVANAATASKQPVVQDNMFEEGYYHTEIRHMPLSRTFPLLQKHVRIRRVATGILDAQKPVVRFRIKNRIPSVIEPQKLQNDALVQDLIGGVSHFYFLRAYTTTPMNPYVITDGWDPAEGGAVMDIAQPTSLLFVVRNYISAQVEDGTTNQFAAWTLPEDGWTSISGTARPVGFAYVATNNVINVPTKTAGPTPLCTAYGT